MHEIAAVQLRAAARQVDRLGWRTHIEECYAPAQPQSFDTYLTRAADQFPQVFHMWYERLEATSAAFSKTKTGNAANVSDVYSWIFRDFVEMYAVGRVLDIGCGVFGRPYYLSGYPAELISGLEPLPMREPADFELIRGLSEYLPWPDASFSTVISATSLDHCLSLKCSLDEIARVLRPNGQVLLWINSVPGSPKYESGAPDFTPADQYHLFHFDKAWLEPLLEQEFEFIDRVELKRQSYSHIFYNLHRKQASAQNGTRA
jgi:SAM-dependent methyltransferase